ncbi:MAG: lysophospholipid acyltransferase family protein [Polyangiales bacterium]
MIRPTAEQLALLEGFERTAFRMCDTVNRSEALKSAAHAFLKTVGMGWVHYCTRNILNVYGLEHLTSLAPDRGVLIAANHRSFFDLYVISSVLLRRTRWVERMYFPVRGDYWYERADALVANGLMSAWAMYPPVLRKPEKRAFNQYTVDFLTEAIARPGTVVGMHPEGTRNKTDDPYTLLPAQPGIGQIIRAGKPIVLPVFILGLGNDLPKQVKGNFDGTGEPITVVFGAPLDLRRQFEQPARLRTYMSVSTHLRDALTALGAEERAIRAREGFPSKAPASRASAA